MPKKERRFRELVEASGKPEVFALWTAPQKDRSFMKAVKENRVLTVIQEPRSKRKDFGLIGFHKNPCATYLVFPKPLEREDQIRVVGINYDWVQRPKSASPRADYKSAPRVPVVNQEEFNVILRREAVLETILTVWARDKADAAAKAVERVRREPFDLSKAIVKNEVKGIG